MREEKIPNKPLEGKQKHTLQYIMNISFPYCLLLLTSSNGKCRLISRCEQHAGLMDQQWHMCSCASLVSRCVSLSLLPRCPSKPSFVSIVLVPSIRHTKKRNRNILYCRSLCLAPPPSPWQPPALPNWNGVCFAFMRPLAFCSEPGFLSPGSFLREWERGLHLEALILFSHLVYKCIAPLALFLMILNLWRDPGP